MKAVKRGKMFLAQKRINEVIIFCILADIVVGYLLKKLHGQGMSLPLVLLYALNLSVIFFVYRFWKYPVFEWDENGFTLYGIWPYRKDSGLWDKVEQAGFKNMTVKKGRVREYLMIEFRNRKGFMRTGMVPVDMVGFSRKVKEELTEFLKEKGVRQYRG